MLLNYLSDIILTRRPISQDSLNPASAAEVILIKLPSSFYSLRSKWRHLMDMIWFYYTRAAPGKFLTVRRPECEVCPVIFPYDMSNHAVLTLMQSDGVERRGVCCRVCNGPGGLQSETIMAYLSVLKTNLEQLIWCSALPVPYSQPTLTCTTCEHEYGMNTALLGTIDCYNHPCRVYVHSKFHKRLVFNSIR